MDDYYLRYANNLNRLWRLVCFLNERERPVPGLAEAVATIEEGCPFSELPAELRDAIWRGIEEEEEILRELRRPVLH